MSTSIGRNALLLCVSATAVLASGAHAGIAPDVEISLMVSNGFNTVMSPAGAPTGGDIYSFVGSDGDADFEFTWDFSADAVSSATADMFLGNGFTVVNNSDGPLDFWLTMTMQLQNPAGAPLPQYGGSAGFTVTGLASTLSSVPGEDVVSHYADGGLIASYFNDPYSLSANGDGSSNSDSDGSFFDLAGPVTSSISATFHFTLTGDGSIATSTGVIGVIPAPAAIAMLGMGAVGRRRRRA